MVLEIIYTIIILIVIFLIFWKLYFSRATARRIPEKGIVSPADGKIIKIIRTDKIGNIKIKKGLLGEIKTMTSDIAKKCYVIVIVLNIFNVHIQRSPIEGIVKRIRYSKGKFHNAVFGASSLKALENEKNEIIIENKDTKIKVIQIAGFVARRIKCYVEENEKILKGHKIGMIDLGSQVILVMPSELRLLVREGQRVIDGETIIARK